MPETPIQTEPQTPRDQYKLVFQYLNKNEALEVLRLVLDARKYYNYYKEYMEKARRIIAERAEDYRFWADEVGSTKDDLIAEILWRFEDELKNLIEGLPSPFKMLEMAGEKLPSELFEELKETEKREQEKKEEKPEEEEFIDDNEEDDEEAMYENWLREIDEIGAYPDYGGYSDYEDEEEE
jgi:hypothetical protein